MSFLSNIATVAQYEAKTLRRSWFFRLFLSAAVFILTLMNIGFYSPIGDETWEMVSIPASLPLMNLYLLNIGQAIVVIFLASDFLKRDKKLDTNEVLYTRSMSNLEYILGKTWGILRLFLLLDILILSIGLIINIISKSMTIDIMAYLEYLMIICVPTIIFSLGLAFVLMSVIRNQAITFLLLLGFAALDMFYLYFRFGSVFDYMAFGMPVFKSTIIGFDNPGILLNQRLIFLFGGLALVFATVLLFKRLPQSKILRILTIAFLIIFLAGAAVCTFNTYTSYSRRIDDKKLVIETNRLYENKFFPRVTNTAIVYNQKGSSLEATVRLTILNDNEKSLDHYLFSLNPLLNVSKITSQGRTLNFKRMNSVIDIDPGKELNRGEADSLEFYYSGRVNESFCYPDYSDNIKANPYRIVMLNVNKRQAFMTKQYVLLTPETYWYPVAGLNYYPSNPARIKVDFTRYSLRVRTQNNLVAVSQGKMKQENGDYIYSPEDPLTGLTLAIGDYLSDRLKVDSVEYITYYYPGHDYYKKDLSQLKDTVSFLISGIMRDLETNFSTRYPFKTLSLLEVPVQFFSYPRKNTQTRAEVQPSLVILPEKLATVGRDAGFAKRFARQKRYMARNNQVITDKELQVRLFNNFIRSTFISGANFRFVNGVAFNEPTRYLLGPSFYFFQNNFYSEQYPVINAVFESHLQKVNTPGRPPGFDEGFGINLNDHDRANLILKGKSFKELLASNPGGDTLRTVLTVKGDWLFNLFRSKPGIDKFNNWFLQYIDNNRFKSIDILQLNKEISEKLGFEFFPYLDNWYNGREQPGFLFSNLQVNEIIVGDRSRFQVTFIASNPEPVNGLFNISFNTGGESKPSAYILGTGAGQISIKVSGMDADDISRIVYLGPGEAKKIGIVLDVQPRAMLINTLFAKDIPGELSFPINDIPKSKEKIKEFDGEEILTSLPAWSEPFETIVDNEDPGFMNNRHSVVNPLRKLLGVQNRAGDIYQKIRTYGIPEYWQPVVQSSYYGKYIRSAVYTRASTGALSVTWAALISKPGYYDIYTYIGKISERATVKTGTSGADEQMDDQERAGDYKDLHFKIYHDQGVEEITVDYGNADPGWNKLGTYYMSSDTAKVVLTNQSSGRIVIGDAVKWVLQK